MAEYLIGVDGGNSKTEVAVASSDGELLARVRAVSRRSASPDDEALVTLGAIRIDLQAHSVTRVANDGQLTDVRLTPTEWQLVRTLVRNAGKLITQRDLLRSLRGPTYDDAGHVLRQYMAQLRQKLEADPSRPRYLLTEPGMGYRFQP